MNWLMGGNFLGMFAEGSHMFWHIIHHFNLLFWVFWLNIETYFSMLAYGWNTFLTN